MLDTSPSPSPRGVEVGRAGGAERHGTAVPSGAGSGAGRMEGGGGRPPVRRVAPERPRLDGPLRARRPVLPGRSVAPPGELPPSDRCRDRGHDLRAPPHRAPSGEGRREPGPVPLLDLPVPEAPRPGRAPEEAQAPG